MRCQKISTLAVIGLLIPLFILNGQNRTDRYKQARDNLVLGDISRTISILLRLAVETEMAPNRTNSFIYQKESVQLPDSAWIQLERILIRLNLQPANVERSVVFNRGMQPSPAFIATYRRNLSGQPQYVRNLPLRMSWQGGPAKFSGSLLTDSGGKGNCQVQQVLSFSNNQKLIAHVDASGFIDFSTLSKDLQQRILTLPWPGADIKIKVLPIPVSLTTTENRLGKPSRPSIGEQFLLNALGSSGFQVVADSNEPEYKILLNIVTQKGPNIQTQYAVYLDFQLQVMRKKNGDVVFDRTMKQIKGVGNSYLLAYQNALDRLTQIFKDEIVPAISQAIVQ